MIKVNYRALGMLSTNCYVVENPDSQKVLIVDPGDSPLEIERQIDEIDGDPEAILLTHGHFDHMLAADALRKKYHIPVYVHEKEQHLLGDARENLSGLWSAPYTMQADKNGKKRAIFCIWRILKSNVLATPAIRQERLLLYSGRKSTFFRRYAVLRIIWKIRFPDILRKRSDCIGQTPVKRASRGCDCVSGPQR